jgi:hypothetical protein
MPFSSGLRSTAAAAATRLWDISVQFAFADHVLDTDRREPRCGSELIAVAPQVLGSPVAMNRICLLTYSNTLEPT